MAEKKGRVRSGSFKNSPKGLRARGEVERAKQSNQKSMAMPPPGGARASGLAARIAQVAAQRTAAAKPQVTQAAAGAKQAAGKPAWVQRAQQNTLSPKSFRAGAPTERAGKRQATPPTAKTPPKTKTPPKPKTPQPGSRGAPRKSGPPNAPGMNRTGQSRKRYTRR